VSLLSDFEWQTKYDADGRSLVETFFIPALESATRYDRTTGYFSAGVLMLASRGVEGLVRNGGRMRLVVGCTLGEAEVAAIDRGQQLKALVQERFSAMPLEPTGDAERQALELLSWMIARGHLEMKVAIPCDARRRPVATTVLFHEKAGLVEDKVGHRLAFNGSVNETAQGWSGNWESFHVFTDWNEPSDRRRVNVEEESFQKLWNDRAQRCMVIDIPDAARDGLLQFLPQDGAMPSRLQDLPTPVQDEFGTPSGRAARDEPEKGPAPDQSELRRLVWSTIAHSASWPGGGERVGEATSIVTPWPHQTRAFERLYST